MTQYSNSRLSTYENCPLKYKFQYIDKIRTEGEGIEAFTGSRVHDALEQFYKDMTLCKTRSLEELLDLYKEYWDKKYSEKVTIRREGMNAGNYFDFGAKCISKYYERYQPFDQATTLYTELRVQFPLDGGDYEILGYIDRLDQRADGIYEIHDYKTSASLPEIKKLESDRQPAFYHLGVKNRFPDAERIEIVWHYLGHDKEYRITLDEGWLESLEEETKTLIDTIEAATDFPTNETALCDWCDYQQLCPARKHLIKVEQLPVNEYLKDDGVVLVNRYAELKEQEKELDEEIEKVKEALCAHAEREGLEVIRGNAKKVRVKLEEVTKYPSSGTPEREELEALLSAAGLLPEVSSLSLSKLAAVLDSREWPEELANQVRAFGKRESGGSVRISNLKDDELLVDKDP